MALPAPRQGEGLLFITYHYYASLTALTQRTEPP